MLSFLYGFLGAVAALALLAVARFRRRFRRGGPSRLFLRGLFRRLGTRPEQEEVLSAEADALAVELRALREEGRTLRAEVAALLEAPALDAAAVEAAFRARVERLHALRGRAAEAIARVHATLDVGQRRALAELLRSGPRRHGHAHGCG